MSTLKKFVQKRKGTLGIIGLVVLLGILLSWNRIFPGPAPALENTDPASLPGAQMSAAPWIPEVANLQARLRAIDLPALAREGSALHIHQHIDLIINGSAIQIPAGIGISTARGFISPLHTHDTSGTIHVESDTIRDFTLGQFFDVWGVPLTAECLGTYCADATHTFQVYVNGTLVPGNPRDLKLESHQEIMFIYGDPSKTPTVISTYAFTEPT